MGEPQYIAAAELVEGLGLVRLLSKPPGAGDIDVGTFRALSPRLRKRQRARLSPVRPCTN
jgi:hypothetical protein